MTDTRFEPIPLYSTPCNNCGKLIKDHFDGYCQRQKPEVTSPLSDDELVKAGQMTSVGLGYIDAMRRVAIAAKIATIREIAAMSSETTLLRSELLQDYDSVEERVNAAIAEFQRKLLAGIGE